MFSNEIAGDLNAYEPGSWVEVHTHKGLLLGSGYINPKSLIAVRLVCPPNQDFSADFLAGRLTTADTRRSARFYPGARCYRMVFGESDGLPGLIVDRYEDVYVYQITTLGMSLLEGLFREVMIDRFRPRALVCRNDSPVRLMEGLPLTKGLVFGELPDPLWIQLDGIEYLLEPLEGQKTGFYLDQRDNRRRFRRWVEGRNVLDLFCYNGAWSLVAASAGAERVVGVDQSPWAVEQAGLNAARNGLSAICRFEEEEAFHYLRNVPKGSFDVIVVDPPAFAKTRSTLPQAQKGYTDLNRRALLALPPGGILVTCSCSYHVDDALFVEILLRAAQAAGRQVLLLEARGQALDHPILLAMPETRYLKCYFLQVL